MKTKEVPVLVTVTVPEDDDPRDILDALRNDLTGERRLPVGSAVWEITGVQLA